MDGKPPTTLSPLPLLLDRRRTPRDSDTWIPRFCTGPVAFWGMAISQLVLVFILLAPIGRWPPTWEQVALGTLYVQWLCVLNLAALCAIRHKLMTVPTPVAAMAMLLTVAATTTAGAGTAAWFQALLSLAVVPTTTGAMAFAASSAAMAVLVMAVALRYAYVAAQWRRGVAATARAQFEALQARIRPHFLFNSMNTIAALIRSRPNAAESAVEDLSDLFRAALRDDSRPSTLAEDLELAQRYLAIEKLRLGERLGLELDLDPIPAIETPHLLLQPLVENAIVHGIEALPEGGTIRLSIKAGPTGTAIEIRNPKPRETRRSRGSGTALDNVRRRLDYHFADRAHMEVDEGADYYAVRIQLPAA